MVWAADYYFQDLEMFLILCVLWEQGGFLIHIHNHTWIWPHFGMDKIAIHTKKKKPCPVPITSILLPNCPRVQWN